jgi:hypothetical protein
MKNNRNRKSKPAIKISSSPLATLGVLRLLAAIRKP